MSPRFRRRPNPATDVVGEGRRALLSRSAVRRVSGPHSGRLSERRTPTVREGVGLRNAEGDTAPEYVVEVSGAAPSLTVGVRRSRGRGLLLLVQHAAQQLVQPFRRVVVLGPQPQVNRLLVHHLQPPAALPREVIRSL